MLRRTSRVPEQTEVIAPSTPMVAVRGNAPPRPVVLIGAELEENLSLRYLATAVQAAGFAVELVPFDDAAHADAVVARTAALDPPVVGLSVPFQLRAREFLALAQALRAAGVRAHITAGGHFATFEHADILRDFPAIDSVVRHEGELTLRELCERVRAGEPVAGIGGTVVRADGQIVDGGKRRLPPLDDLGFPDVCRAEVYAGTPRKRLLEAQGRLRGDYFGWGYELRDERVEVLFRIAVTAFAVRNFRPDGVAHLNMGLRFDSEVARRFYPDSWDGAWHERLLDFQLPGRARHRLRHGRAGARPDAVRGGVTAGLRARRESAPGRPDSS